MNIFHLFRAEVHDLPHAARSYAGVRSHGPTWVKVSRCTPLSMYERNIRMVLYQTTVLQSVDVSGASGLYVK
jgi:hypothetical protein